MANIELPKDAEGREISLDTVVLFDSCGKPINIRRWVYTTDFNPKDSWVNSWRAINEDFYDFDPELLYLNQPDSWEKLEEDLSSCSISKRYTPCAYFNKSGNDCEKCLADPNKECVVQMTKHIALRIHKLRGEC